MKCVHHIFYTLFMPTHLCDYISGCTVYLSIGHGVAIPPSQYWYCTLSIAVFFSSQLCTMLIIVNMTFGRFYSIIRPHKAAAFNTLRRARIIIAVVVLFSVLYNVPHLLTSSNEEWICLPYGKKSVMAKPYALLYYWLSFIIQFVFPFISLLIMNCVIIHKMHSSSDFRNRQGTEGNVSGPGGKLKKSEKQVYVTLLLVTFGFLILTTPSYLFFIFIMVIDFTTSPKMFAAYYLFFSAAQQMNYTNNGINFFLYVISGKKFRSNLVKLFVRERNKKSEMVNNISIDIAQ